MFAQGQMQDSHLADKKVYFNQLQANNWIINTYQKSKMKI